MKDNARARDKITDIFFGRILFIIIGFIIQISILWSIICWFRSYFVYFYAFCSVFSILSLLTIIGRTMNPAYKITWIIIIFILPIAGLVLFTLAGGSASKLNKKRLLEIEKKSEPFLKRNDEVYDEIRAKDRHVAGQCEYIQRISKYSAYKNYKTEYFPLGENMFEKMLKELEKAENFIFMEYFIIEDSFIWENITSILLKKVQKGIDVRVIYDDMGCMFTLNRKKLRELESKGIKFCCFNEINPFLTIRYNNRDHRKICVIDGKTAFTGGVNIADEYINRKIRFGHWKDTAVMIKGNAVWSFTVMFLSVWNYYKKSENDFERFHIISEYKENDGFIVPFCDTPADDETLSENVYMNIINNAVDYVYITTPYLILDNEMITSLCSAAKRGVDVRIITPHIPDKKIIIRLTRANYNVLLKSGIKIYEYTSGFIHAKSFVSDDRTAVVGTINLDYRSLYLHFECGLFMYECKAIENIKNDLLETMKISENQKIKKYGFFEEIFNSILKIFAPML